MDLNELQKQLRELTAALPAMQEALKERATQEAVDGGAAVAVRPFSFRHPKTGETDPWFGLAYQDWLTLRHEGFSGVFTTNDVASERAKLFIIYDEAAAYLKARASEQGQTLASRGGVPPRLQAGKDKIKEAAAA